MESLIATVKNLLAGPMINYLSSNIESNRSKTRANDDIFLGRAIKNGRLIDYSLTPGKLLVINNEATI